MLDWHLYLVRCHDGSLYTGITTNVARRFAEHQPAGERKSGVPIKILPWHKFRTSETFDYMSLSRSPSFTPPESDALIPVVEGYMRKI